MIKISAGILIKHKNKILLAHSTNSPWWRSYMPPKGGVEKSETIEEAASREVHEEVGILIDHNLLKEKVVISYNTPSGRLYKIVHIFIHEIKNLSDIGLTEDHIPYSMLQKEEVDEAKFMDLEEVHKKLLPRYAEQIIPILEKYGK